MWQFWIDVGGTFTDCLGLGPDGSEHQIKVLSSGRVKGSVEGWSDRGQTFFSSFLVGSGGAGFWTGARVDLLSATGEVVDHATVNAFDYTNGHLRLATPVPSGLHAEIVNFELDHDWHSPVLAIREILRLGPHHLLPDCRVHLGTTRGTNALLTRAGALTALVTTAGFRDMLRIGDQARPHLFKLAIKKPDTLFKYSLEVNERVLADGTVEVSPSPDDVRKKLGDLKAKTGVQSIAVCLMHGYRFPEHEKLVGQIAREVGFEDVRMSHKVAPLIKIVPRGETTVLDAYLNPVIGRYLDEIQNSFSANSQLRLMTSSGGLVSRQRFSGKDSVLSGPAGGVVGAARVAEQAGFSQAIAFDMGGTSTDVARYDGAFEMEYETRKAGVRIVNSMLAIETVAAGGGSICRFDGAKLVVGPESATSIPGPACYGAGGPLTVTDVNLFLGRIVEDEFPFHLDRAAVERRLDEVVQLMKDADFEISREELALGLLEIANQNMAAAIRCVSVAKGYDPKDYVLVSFGGAGSQHCCAVADALGMDHILDHPQGSILSAVGVRLADQTASRVTSVMRLLDEKSLEAVEGSFALMEDEVREQLKAEAVGTEIDPEMTYAVDLRYAGTEPFETILKTKLGFSVEEFKQEFSVIHQQRYGYTQDRELEIASARVTGCVAGNRLASSSPPETVSIRVAEKTCPLVVSRLGSGRDDSVAVDTQTAGLFDRDCLKGGDQIVGPAIIGSELTTTIVDIGWQATVLDEGQLLIQRQRSADPDLHEVMSHSDGGNFQAVDPIQLEIFNNHFSSIARQMGISLQKTSASVNVKERLDFSCAVFTGDGRLVVNAPHIPVHLGAMSHTVRATIEDNPIVKPGDVWVTNDPYRGGSHLPDITVVTPVFVDSESNDGPAKQGPAKHGPNFWVASRSHHAEVGGRTPGSMPADASCLEEEGVLIQNFKLIDGGNDRFEELKRVLSSGRYPSRSPDENISDLAAQVAANRSGETDLKRLVAQHGLAKVLAYMGHIQDAAERKVRQALAKMPDGEFEFTDAMDVANSTIRVVMRKRGEQLKIDFTGTDSVLSSNLNANAAIVSAAVMYVMRCLIEDDIPLNEGVMKPVEIVLPECFLNPTATDDPAKSPAIVGGNVETSQRVVDVILGALGIAAASQGTMNNWLMGDDSFGYYETVCGGSGATRDADGASAVHTHMTNTRLTDPEILESRYPAILREFSIRPSGGVGEHQGGDGIRREVEFTRTLTVSLLTSRRESQPFGLQGGHPGAAGENLLRRKNSVANLESDELKADELEAADEPIRLASQCEVRVLAGDRLILLTPGGGGFGKSDLP